MFGKTLYFRVLENYQKNIFIGVDFKQLKLSNLTPKTALKTDSTPNVFVSVLINVKFTEERLLWNHFLVQ